MFSDLAIAILFGVGASAWIFAKIQRSSGNNTKNSLIAAGASGVIIIIILTIVLQFVFKHTK